MRMMEIELVNQVINDLNESISKLKIIQAKYKDEKVKLLLELINTKLATNQELLKTVVEREKMHFAYTMKGVTNHE